jgi:hypothetical protein
MLRPRAIPVSEERRLGASRFAPTHPMAYSRMTGGHRLTVEPDLLTQPARDPRLRIGELDALGPNPAVATPEPPLSIDQRHRMGGPRHIVPGPIPDRSHATHVATAATPRIPAQAPPLNPDRQPTVGRLAVAFRRDHPKSRQSQDPRRIASRSHRSSLVVCTSRKDDTGWSGARGIALTTRPPEPTAHPAAVGVGGRVLTSHRCTQIYEEPSLSTSRESLLVKPGRGREEKL